MTPGGGETVVAGGDDDPLGEPAERDLRVGALQHRQRQAQEHVAAAAERETRARVARRMGGVGRGRFRLGQFEQPRDLGVDVQAPAGVLIEPATQFRRVAADKPERVRVGAVT